MKLQLSLFLLFLSFNLLTQTLDYESIKPHLINLNQVTDSNEDFTGYEPLKDLLKGVEIVMLGEQSHGEGTTFETKIKLVKYLHEEMGYDILAFESGLYDCHKAWTALQNRNEGMDMAFGKSIFFVWSMMKEFRPFRDYIQSTIDSDNPLKIVGFDNQWSGRMSEYHFLDDLESYLQNVNPSFANREEWTQLDSSMTLALTLRLKKYKKKQARKDTAFVQEIIDYLVVNHSNPEAQFWIRNLKGTKGFISDLKLKTNGRDQQMAENLDWIKAQNPGKKIICWGATSHFLYNSSEVRMTHVLAQFAANHYKKNKMMGDYVKEKYKDKVYTIGFTANKGDYGLNRKIKLKPPKENSLEFILAQSEYDNFLLPLKGLKISPLLSRPLGNYYMKTDISRVMDAVIFNQEMERPKLDKNLLLKIYPENKYIKPEPVE